MNHDRQADNRVPGDGPGTPRRKRSTYEGYTAKPKDDRPKVTPVFASTAAPRSKTAALAVDVFGRVTKTETCADAEAASHWDARLWRRG